MGAGEVGRAQFVVSVRVVAAAAVAVDGVAVGVGGGRVEPLVRAGVDSAQVCLQQAPVVGETETVVVGRRDAIFGQLEVADDLVGPPDIGIAVEGGTDVHPVRGEPDRDLGIGMVERFGRQNRTQGVDLPSQHMLR
ncbi:hypothetical protein OHA40_02525 [Nocardia sp. NBC_00508]|uniref:hypothetical protein n=1 Tax=Nocardia sp. NBC_00508 TaxID=2975992 RepID=UPI002E809CDC|nr:hypothetical protein [Nocardia sp. NBC_00508]WUD67056.1 hypothetical protein OHA40_02525 [Nocardia sp. NBC_00508]